MSEPYLPAVEVEPNKAANAAVIWLHGLGADGHDFEPIVPHLGIDEQHAVRFVFPHAPSIPVTINNGYVMPAWYDILEPDLDRRLDEAQLRASADAVARLIEREVERGIPTNKIVVAGFSQGGAVGFELALSHPKRLAGLIAISTYFATKISIEVDEANAGLPILICHGLNDPVVPEHHGQESHRLVTEMGYAAEYKTYPVEHGVDLQEIIEIGAWINRVLAT